MKTSFARQIRDALKDARGVAAEKWAEFEQARTDYAEKGIDVASDAEAFEQLTGLSEAYSEAKTRVLELEEKFFQASAIDAAGEDGVTDPRDLGRKADEVGNKLNLWTPGQRLTESDVYKALLASGTLDRQKSRVNMDPMTVASRDEFKAFLGLPEAKALLTGLSDTSGGAFVRNDRLAGFFGLPMNPWTLLDFITVAQTDSDVVEWVEETGFTNAAAPVAEATGIATGGVKPESALAYAIVQSTVRTIAHWIPVTKRALADVANVRTMIDTRLRDGVRLALEAQMMSGAGTGENLLGIVNTPGIASIAVGVAPDNALRALLRAITAIRLAFMEPTAIFIHPNDWMDIRLMRDASGASADTGGFLFGPPSMAGPMQVWGVPAIASATVPEGNPIVGKMDEAVLWVREGVSITATDAHADFFIRNLVAILAEGRYAFGIPRPEAFAEVTGA